MADSLARPVYKKRLKRDYRTMALSFDVHRSTVAMECATGGRLAALPVIIGRSDNQLEEKDKQRPSFRAF